MLLLHSPKSSSNVPTAMSITEETIHIRNYWRNRFKKPLVSFWHYSNASMINFGVIIADELEKGRPTAFVFVSHNHSIRQTERAHIGISPVERVQGTRSPSQMSGISKKSFRMVPNLATEVEGAKETPHTYLISGSSPNTSLTRSMLFPCHSSLLNRGIEFVLLLFRFCWCYQ